MNLKQHDSETLMQGRQKEPEGKTFVCDRRDRAIICVNFCDRFYLALLCFGLLVDFFFKHKLLSRLLHRQGFAVFFLHRSLGPLSENTDSKRTRSIDLVDMITVIKNHLFN